MIINREDLIKILSLDTRELYAMFRMMIQPDLDRKEVRELYYRVRFGEKIKFDINDYIDFKNQEYKSFRFHANSNTMIIYKKAYDRKDFWDEIEEREAIMRNYILNNIELTDEKSELRDLLNE